MHYDSIQRQLSTSNYICDFECTAFSLKDTTELQYQDVLIYNQQQNKYDLENDFTFVVPIKIDCPERKSNLDTVLSFISKHFINYELIVSEQSSKQVLNDLEFENYVFWENTYNIIQKFKQLLVKRFQINGCHLIIMMLKLSG